MSGPWSDTNPQQIEAKWQRVWEDERAFHIAEPGAGEPAPRATGTSSRCCRTRPGNGMHMGHVLNYTMGDVITHFRRRNGWTVLRPMGWDAFGLPAENAAIREGGHPREITERNIETIRAQMKRLGWAIDWDREVSSHEPELLPLDAVAVPAVLRARPGLPQGGAGQLVPERPDRRRERVRRRRPLRALRRRGRAAEHDAVVLQDHGLRGRAARVRPARGRLVARAVEDDPAQLDRPLRRRGDPLPRRGAGRRRARSSRRGRTRCSARRSSSSRRSIRSSSSTATTRCASTRGTPGRAAPRIARRAEAKTGVFTGLYATNPVNGERLPIYVADYVLMDYGTGAIMAVPAHDERDREFAEAFDLPIVEVVDRATGVLVRLEASFDGAAGRGGEARDRRVAARARAAARRRSRYRLRDWSFSRQRYWGCPIPIVHCGACGVVPVPEDELPVLLPEVEDYLPKGKPPLASNEEWHARRRARAAAATRRARRTRWTRSSTRRGTSCATSTRTTTRRRSTARVVDYWLPVNQYIGGIDHADGAPAVLALLRQGHERHGHGRLPRAVRAPVPPGLGADGRDEDVEDAGQRHRAGGAGRGVRSGRGSPVHPVHGPGRSGHGVDAHRHRGRSRASCAGCGGSSARSPQRRLRPAKRAR